MAYMQFFTYFMTPSRSILTPNQSICNQIVPCYFARWGLFEFIYLCQRLFNGRNRGVFYAQTMVFCFLRLSLFFSQKRMFTTWNGIIYDVTNPFARIIRIGKNDHTAFFFRMLYLL